MQVCPTGIDIRQGLQLECVGCTACIDACDDMMAKIGKPRGLVDYLALKDEVDERAHRKHAPIMKHIFRPRTILYTALWSVIGFALVFALFIRPEIDMTVAPVRNPTYIVQSDGTVRNVYDVRLRNKQGEPRPFGLSLNIGTNLSIHVEGVDGTLVIVPADEMKQVRVYVDAPKGSPESTTDRSPFTFWVTDLNNQDRASVGTIFNGRTN